MILLNFIPGKIWWKPTTFANPTMECVTHLNFLCFGITFIPNCVGVTFKDRPQIACENREDESR